MNARRIRFTAVLCFIVVLLSACGKLPAGVSVMRSGSEIISANPVENVHSCLPDRFKKAAESQELELLLDKSSGSVAVRRGDSEELFTALPLIEDPAACVLSAALVSAAGRTYLNSQDNSVAFSSHTVERVENGVKIVYAMAMEKGETGGALLRVPVVFRLSGNAMRVSVDCSEITVAEGFILEKLSLLPFFGALPAGASAAAEGASPYRDYLLVPDGCGALLYTDALAGQEVNLTCQVYADAANAAVAAAPVGYFGASRNNSDFLALISGGEAYAGVRALCTGAGAQRYAAVYPEFTITQNASAEGKYYYAAPYVGEISVDYYFPHGENGNFTSLATTCREALIRAGILSSESVSANDYPLNVELVMNTAGGSSGVRTRFAQAEELTEFLKAKGVDSLNLILDGCFSDGIYHAGGPGRAPRSLGGNKGLASLCASARAQNANVYLGVNVLYAQNALHAAAGLRGSKASVFAVDPESVFGTASGKNVPLATASAVENNASLILRAAGKFPLKGFAVNDAASYLYADIKNGVGAAEMSETIARSLDAFSAQNSLCVRGANAYALRSAALITELPCGAFYPETAYYAAIPFLPAVLHGTLVYSGAPANTASSTLLSLLKCVEYGAAPYVKWVYASDSPLCYEHTYADTVEFYAHACAALADLADRRIVSHDKLDEGLYTTSFEGNAVIVVNYNHYSVNVGNITVPPYDFIRIN